MISEDILSESNALKIQATSIVFFVVTPIFIAFRLWSRVARRSRLGWDDTIIIISFAVLMVSCNYGFGQHIRNLTAEDKLMALKCNPVRGAWDKSVKPTCVSLDMNWHANAGFSIAADVLILMLPMQPIWTSKLSVAHKRALMMVLTMGGGVVVVTSIVRMTTLKTSAKSTDTTYDITSTMLTIVEQNLAIICTCLPMCRTPLAILFPPWFSGSKISTHDGSQLTGRSQGQPRAWNPYVGPRNAQGITRSVVLLNGESGDEAMLDALERTGTPSTLASDAGVIRKTVEYGVTYETNPDASR
ncbi:hypothetical protein FSARC_11000 [Fusarium sarcochroum]|uniref:Rhodopsin domain-containing protein n=1 Tax=Fusarium sarcochroum TaxID=1208366 RepID=A0A8H4TIN4_9HYPO|nr:hypothetical protein FSARC_11000 [Fusarium sarcochroum]